ncbi:MAG TPA: hypothetical protein VGZ27_11845 [Vicinamibacterales bacterium]|nr:hypothetical protein [Vicinamibacterales bacterium]
MHGTTVVHRNDWGEFQVDSKDTHPALATAVGVGIGALIGALAGPAGAAIGAARGTAIGAASGGRGWRHRGSESRYETAWVLGAGQSAVIADVSEDTAFPIDERMRILGGRPARLGASRRRSPAKAQRPPVGGGTDRQHGWQTTDPLCWRYAGCEILAILA